MLCGAHVTLPPEKPVFALGVILEIRLNRFDKKILGVYGSAFIPDSFGHLCEPPK